MKIQNFSDEQLVEKARADVDFFAPLMDRYDRRLAAYIRRISNFCPETVEEILQDIFLKVWKNLNDFDGRVAFRSWIYRIAHNETISRFRWFRSRGHDTEVEFDETVSLPEKTDFVLDLDVKLSGKKIQQILAQVPKKYREILVLKFYDDLSYTEISDILKKPMGTIATLVSRAKKSFREIAQRTNTQF
ncbi:RNA polymerase sigma factor [bacterium]|jgi:RNA polymerase sigma-70 factor, ECF subfamily|nr:RNA polymerase sigma factor [bacterium]MBT6832384.1 RNA polymerase sigma factor [bacterium]MBT6995929.1 RNA polymerase sigma factor [bacterium]MBT7772790.1 RNA polymerase sigma factor [bacterium]